MTNGQALIHTVDDDRRRRRRRRRRLWFRNVYAKQCVCDLDRFRRTSKPAISSPIHISCLVYRKFIRTHPSLRRLFPTFWTHSFPLLRSRPSSIYKRFEDQPIVSSGLFESVSRRIMGARASGTNIVRQ